MGYLKHLLCKTVVVKNATVDTNVKLLLNRQYLHDIYAYLQDI